MCAGTGFLGEEVKSFATRNPAPPSAKRQAPTGATLRRKIVAGTFTIPSLDWFGDAARRHLHGGMDVLESWILLTAPASSGIRRVVSLQLLLNAPFICSAPKASITETITSQFDTGLLSGEHSVSEDPDENRVAAEKHAGRCSFYPSMSPLTDQFVGQQSISDG